MVSSRDALAPLRAEIAERAHVVQAVGQLDHDDRLHNMRTLGYLSRRAARAHRARDHRDLRAHRAPPRAWAKSAANWKTSRSSTSIPRPTRRSSRDIESRRHSNEEFLDEIRQTVEGRAAPRRHSGAHGRPHQARLIRSSRSSRRQKISLDQVYDLMALRIITDSVKNCYAALGVIHNKWRPIPGRIKDFIAIPRPNLYQSLHTSVVGPARADLRSADPHRGDAPHRRRRHRGALEIQGRAARARRPTTSASPGCATWSSGSGTCRIPASSCPRSRWTCTRKRSTPSRRAAR